MCGKEVDEWLKEVLGVWKRSGWCKWLKVRLEVLKVCGREVDEWLKEGVRMWSECGCENKP